MTSAVWAAIAAEAERESSLWAAALRPVADRETEAVFSPLAADRYAIAVETIYEGYLVHYGTPRLFRTPDPDQALLLGDYLYAHGLVRVADLGDVDAVAALADLIAHCAYLRGEGRAGDGDAWARTVASLGRTGSEGRRAETASALAAHARRVG